MSRIALDAMGGDRAPSETVAGALSAAADGYDVVLVGHEEKLSAELAEHGAELPIRHAPETIDMGDDPRRALREKPDSSVVVTMRMVAEGEADAAVSAGSTGAAFGAAAVNLKRAPGVRRPAIAAIFPTPGSPTVVLDSGANPEVKAEHLLQFGIMGSVMAHVYFGLESPRVAMLNIGEERGKGRAIDREAYELLSNADINFVGNVEGRDLATDRADVIVTDGFTGNVFLKTTEGAVAVMVALAMEALGDLPEHLVPEVVPRLSELRLKMNYEEVGGAILLGVNGVVVIAHGSSNARAVRSAIRLGKEGADAGLVQQLDSKLNL